MAGIIRQIIEIVFTSYLLPALLLPLVWLASALRRSTTDPMVVIRRTRFAYLAVAAAFALMWALARSGVPIEAGGRWLTALAWIAFVMLHLLFAMLAATMTAKYASLPEGTAKESSFVFFLAIVVLHPAATAAGVSVLYRLLRLVYHQVLPGIDLVPGGI